MGGVPKSGGGLGVVISYKQFEQFFKGENLTEIDFLGGQWYYDSGIK